MNKPNNFDNTRAAGDYEPIELGGHYCIIIGVEETKSSTGKDMLKVAFDFDGQDKQAGYFKKDFDADVRPNKKWPYQGVVNIVVKDNDGNCSRSFKSFCNAVEASNNATIEWGNGFCAWFKGKKVGAVYGEEESYFNGKINRKPRHRFWCQTSAVQTAKIPAAKTVDRPATQTPSNDFVSVPEGSMEEIPF